MIAKDSKLLALGNDFIISSEYPDLVNQSINQNLYSASSRSLLRDAHVLEIILNDSPPGHPFENTSNYTNHSIHIKFIGQSCDQDIKSRSYMPLSSFNCSTREKSVILIPTLKFYR